MRTKSVNGNAASFPTTASAPGGTVPGEGGQRPAKRQQGRKHPETLGTSALSDVKRILVGRRLPLFAVPGIRLRLLDTSPRPQGTIPATDTDLQRKMQPLPCNAILYCSTCTTAVHEYYRQLWVQESKWVRLPPADTCATLPALTVAMPDADCPARG